MIKARLLSSTVSDFLSSGKYWETTAEELAYLAKCDVRVVRTMEKLNLFGDEVIKETQTQFWYKMPVCLGIIKKHLGGNKDG